MDNLAKTIILSGSKDKAAKAILSLKSSDKSEIKFFNMRQLPNSLAVGIRQKCKVSKFPIDVCGGVGKFDLQSKIDLKEPFVCAVVDVSNAFCPELVLCSSEEGHEGQAGNKIETAFVQGAPEDRSTLYAEQSQEEIDNLIDQNISDDMACQYFDSCARCKYKQAFYAECDGERHVAGKDDQKLANKTDGKEIAKNMSKNTPNIDENDKKNGQGVLTASSAEMNNVSEQNEGEQEEVDQSKDVLSDDATFFEQIKPQIDLLFSKYPSDDKLSSLVPNSKWVKVNYEGTEECYELGIICDEEGREEYICYGIPSPDAQNPPKSLEDYARYLKLSQTDGLWVACQDAKTGETIKLDFGK